MKTVITDTALTHADEIALSIARRSDFDKSAELIESINTLQQTISLFPNMGHPAQSSLFENHKNIYYPFPSKAI